MNSINARLEAYFEKFKEVAKNEFNDRISDFKNNFTKQKSSNCKEHSFSFVLDGEQYSFPVWYSGDKAITYNIAHGNKKAKQDIIKKIVEKTDPYFGDKLTSACHTFQADKNLFDEIKNDFSCNPYKIETTNQENRVNIIMDNVLRVSVSFYDSTKNLLVQGKTTTLWNNIFFFISEKLNLSSNDIVTTYITSIPEFNGTKIEISQDILDFKLKSNIGKEMYTNDKKMLLIKELEFLKASGQFLSLNIEAPDYSFMLGPSFRVIEGLLRRIIANKQLINAQQEPSKQFYQFHTDKNQLDVQYHQSLNNDKIAIDGINKLYGIYNKYRCMYNHSDGINPAIIEDKDKAIAIYDEICTLLKELYSICEKFI